MFFTVTEDHMIESGSFVKQRRRGAGCCPNQEEEEEEAQIQGVASK